MDAASKIEAAIERYEDLLSNDAEHALSQNEIAEKFGVNRPTISRRLNGVNHSCKHAFTHLQNLTPVEEDCLVHWIGHMASIGQPQTPAATKDLANHIIRNRVFLTPPSQPISFTSVGEKWFRRFKNRHPMVKSLYSRTIEAARVDASSPEALGNWFTALRTQFDSYDYNPADVYNMDETGYAIGFLQSRMVLIVLEQAAEKQAWQAGKDKGEWVTSIECVSAAGKAIPPLIIMKGKEHFKTAWAPRKEDCIKEGVDIDNWTYTASTSGWTCNETAHVWLIDVFEPHTRPSVLAIPRKRRLLIMDGHGSHIQSRDIAFCMQHDIDVLILPPHTSSITQPLDVSIFRPLKGAMTERAAHAMTYNPGVISRPHWVILLVRARLDAMTERNIRSGFKATGIHPFNPDKVTPLSVATPTASRNPLQLPRTPASTETMDILREHGSNLAIPVKRHLKTMQSALDKERAEKVVLDKENQGYKEAMHRTKKPRATMGVRLLGTHLINQGHIGQAVEDKENETKAKKTKKGKGKAKEVSRASQESSPDYDAVFLAEE